MAPVVNRFLWGQTLLLLGAGIARSWAMVSGGPWARAADARAGVLCVTAAAACIMMLPMRRALRESRLREAFDYVNLIIQLLVWYSTGAGLPGASMCSQHGWGILATLASVIASCISPVLLHTHAREHPMTVRLRISESAVLMSAALMWAVGMWRLWPAMWPLPTGYAYSIASRGAMGFSVTGDADFLMWADSALASARKAAVVTVSVSAFAEFFSIVHVATRRSKSSSRMAAVLSALFAACAWGCVAERASVAYALRTSSESSPYPATAVATSAFIGSSGRVVAGGGWLDIQQAAVIIAVAGAMQATAAYAGV